MQVLTSPVDIMVKQQQWTAQRENRSGSVRRQFSKLIDTIAYEEAKTIGLEHRLN